MADEPKDPQNVEEPEAAEAKPEAAAPEAAKAVEAPKEVKEEAPAKVEAKAEEAPAAKEAAAPKAESAPADAAPTENAEAKDETKPAAAAAEPAKKAKGKKKTAKAKDEKSADAAPVSISLDDTIEPIKVVRAKGSKNIISGIAHVHASFNNTIVSITDLKGGVIGWSSAGKCGFKGSRKSTAYAAQVIAQDACKQAMGHGLKEVEVRVKGPGSGRESAVRAMQAIGLEVSTIRDVTPVPHNGCRPPKQRRV